METYIQEIRHRIFRETARTAYHAERPVDKRIEELSYRIIPGEMGNFHNDVFLERAIIEEWLRLAMGLPYRSAVEHAPVSDNIETADRPETHYTPPLVNMIKLAYSACHKKRVSVIDGCQNYLAHPCEEVCPKDTVKLDRTNERFYINDDKYIEYGRCADVCSYKAAIIQERPCTTACGMDTISMDENGKVDIDYDKCVSCGVCLVSRPFGTIMGESWIFQAIRTIQSGERVYAAVAPALVGQFGPKVTSGKLRAAMKVLGFADVFKMAVEADLCATQEAIDFIREAPEKLPFVATSCCPAWSMMAKELFSEYTGYIFVTLTPITLTTRLIRRHHSNAKAIFTDSCVAKKLEVTRTDIRSDADFALAFGEMDGIFDAHHADVEKMEGDPEGVNDASTDGRNLAAAGGVAKSMVDVVHQRYPDREIRVANVKGLKGCRRLLTMVKIGKYNGYLLEEMACPGGCVAGAGIIRPIKESQASVSPYVSKARYGTSNETEHVKELDKLADQSVLISLHHDFQDGAAYLRHTGITDSSHTVDGVLGCGVAYVTLWIQYGSVHGQAGAHKGCPVGRGRLYMQGYPAGRGVFLLKGRRRNSVCCPGRVDNIGMGVSYYAGQGLSDSHR